MQVVGERVIVRTEDQSQTERPSGILTIENHAPNVVGVVVACADGLDVQVDDVVIFPPNAGQALIYQDAPYLVLEPDEILAVYEGAQA